MNFKIVAAEIFVILVAGLMLNLPLVAAVNVDIYFGGNKRATATFERDDFVNDKLDFLHEARDILWRDVKVAVRLNSASLAKEIKKIYLYKCKKLSPVNCVQSEPQVFENFVDTELLWTDISEREGSGPYPQVGSLMIILKLEDLDGRESWIGFWKSMRRTAYNTFTEYDHEIGEVEVHATSSDMVDPIKAYIENFGMVPFEWLTKAKFTSASSLHALGADASDIGSSSPNFLTASPGGNEITNINKDFYFIFPETSSGTANSITLNKNPTFTCGDGVCESELGETPSSCCVDCPCPSGQYCDIDPADPTSGECKGLSQISLQVVSTSQPQITDCSGAFDVNISLKINNPPSTLPSEINSVFSIGGETYSTTCYGGPPSYSCLLTIASEKECGQGTYKIEPNEASSTITYTDGSSDVTTTLTATFSAISVSYDCSCDSGFYCDSGEEVCKSEDAITLAVTELNSYLENYNEGDPIELTAKIFNPPTGYTVTQTYANLTLTGGSVSPGSPTCTGPTGDHEYECSIPFQISGYSKSKAYTFDPNTLVFTITFKDGNVDKVRDLSANFGPVSIPSQDCGDGVCNMGEDSSTCCIDCGCPGGDDYCDPVRGCEPKAGVTVSVDAVNPTEFKDCDVAHLANVTLKVNNAPSTLTLDHFYHVRNSVPTGWAMQCDDSLYGGIYYCHLSIPALEGCTLPHYLISNNEISTSISFDDGAAKSPFYSRITKETSSPFSDLKVVPVYHCGDGVCESDLKESASNCCIDCPCSSDKFCDVISPDDNGTCISKSSIKLVVDSPTKAVKFSSCEIDNHMIINAHIKNQPSDSRVEQVYGTLDGKTADMRCDTTSRYGSGNYSFNCSMIVPAKYECKRNDVDVYDDNTFSVLLSYDNGGKTESITLTDDLPKVTVTQTLRSMYEIMEDSRRKMEDLIEKTNETTYKLMKETRDCYKGLQTVMVWSMAIGYGGGLLFGILQMTGITKVGGRSWNVHDFSYFMNVMSNVITTLVKTWAAMCQLKTLSHQISLVMHKMEMDMVRVDICMETIQHQLDIGACRGREESCFNSMVSCMNFANINNWMGGLNSIMNQATNAIRSITNDMNRIYSSAYNLFQGNVYGRRSEGQFTAIVTCEAEGTVGKMTGNAQCGALCNWSEAKFVDTYGCINTRIEASNFDITGNARRKISDFCTSDGCRVTYRFVCITQTGYERSNSMMIDYVKGSKIGCGSGASTPPNNTTNTTNQTSGNGWGGF